MTKTCDRIREIRDVARKLFAKKGYSLTSMDDIAAGVGIAKPSLYYFFESKEHIYADIVNEILKKILIDVDRHYELSKAGTTSLPAIVNEVISDRLKDGIVIRLIDVKIIGMNSSAFREIRATLASMKQKICKLLRLYGVRNEELAAEVLVNAIHCYVLHANHELVIAPPKVYGNYLASLLLPQKSVEARKTAGK